MPHGKGRQGSVCQAPDSGIAFPKSFCLNIVF